MRLTEKEKTDYLSNLVAISRIDGKLTASEENQLGEIQKRIRAKKSQLNTAVQMAEKQGFQPQVFESFSAQVSNLEDMVYIAFIDGDLDEAEKNFLMNYSQKIGIALPQFKAIVQSVQKNLEAVKEAKDCPKCKSPAQGTAKFCANCGSSLENISRDDQVLSTTYQIPNNGITIEFAESTGAGFPNAIEIYNTAPIKAESVKGKKTWYMASWPSNQMPEVLKIVEALSGLRNRAVYLNGEKGNWTDVFSFSYCYNRRNSAYRPFEYCFGLGEKRLNIWGCQLARMDWAHWADWFSYGKYVELGGDKVKFVFDKDRIKHELQNNLFGARLCPHMNSKLVAAILSEFPDEVFPTIKDGPWHFRRDYADSPGAIKITVSEGSGDWEFRTEYYSSAVEPADSSVGLKILRNALEKAQIASDNFAGVLQYKGVEE
ncbi:MAG: hypothetical protein ACRBF0_10060 [Calditrichia bacterium]